MRENKDKGQKLSFQEFKDILFKKSIYKMEQKTQDELLAQLLFNFSINMEKFSINNLFEHIPELIQNSIALGIRFGVDFKNYEEAIRKIREEIEKKKYDSSFI